MQYLHDLWVNWFEEDNPHLVPYFHEWSKKDNVGLMDQIPLMKVNANLYNHFTFGFVRIHEKILESLDGKTYKRVNHERIPDFGFVCTDGERVMTIKLNKEGNVESKSHLIPRQFQLAIEMMKDRKDDFVTSGEVDISKYNAYIGLTRLEKQSMLKIFNFLDRLTSENRSLLKYLISEWNYSLHKKWADLDFNEMKQNFVDQMKNSNIADVVNVGKVIDKLKIIN